MKRTTRSTIPVVGGELAVQIRLRYAMQMKNLGNPDGARQQEREGIIAKISKEGDLMKCKSKSKRRTTRRPISTHNEDDGFSSDGDIFTSYLSL